VRNRVIAARAGIAKPIGNPVEPRSERDGRLRQISEFAADPRGRFRDAIEIGEAPCSPHHAEDYGTADFRVS
jgi:hypothetical protein